jgi:thiol:disulfide interchange protein
MRTIRAFLATLTALASLVPADLSAQASSHPLPAEQAFDLTVDHDDSAMTPTWDIAEGYYLYRDNLGAEGPDGASLALRKPEGDIKDDPNFDTVDVFYNQVVAHLDVTTGPVTLTWQGCEDASICYPPQTRVIDIFGNTEVRAALDPLTLLKVDVIEFGPESQAMMDVLGAAGPPTMIFFNANAAEAPGSRIVGDTGNQEMLRSLRMVSR